MEAPNYENKNILVTGGAGFIGSFLCERLLKEGKRVICIDNLSTGQHNNIAHLLKEPNFEYLRWDVTEPFDFTQFPELERFKAQFQGVQEIYHLACPTSPKKFDEFKQQTLLANSVGMRNVLDVAVKYGSRVVHASTSVVYGMRPEDGHLFKEDEFGTYDHMTPRGCYDEGKRFAETMCSTYADVHGIDVRIARIFRTYGPRMALSDGHMIPDFVLDALEGKDLVIYGDEGFRSSFVYVDDVVDALVKLMEEKQNTGPVNVGSDYDIKIVDIAQKVIEMTESSSKVAYKDPLPFMRPLGLPDLSKIKETGWIPLTTLQKGLEKTIEYTIANKDILRPNL